MSLRPSTRRRTCRATVRRRTCWASLGNCPRRPTRKCSRRSKNACGRCWLRAWSGSSWRRSTTSGCRGRIAAAREGRSSDWPAGAHALFSVSSRGACVKMWTPLACERHYVDGRSPLTEPFVGCTYGGKTRPRMAGSMPSLAGGVAPERLLRYSRLLARSFLGFRARVGLMSRWRIVPFALGHASSSSAD